MELFPRSTRGSRTWPHEIEYTMLAYMTLVNTQTILVYLQWSYMKILLIDEARRAKYISRILKLLEHFTFLIRASNVVKTWCLILQVVAVYSGLLLLKKSFYAFFLTAVYLAVILLVYYTTNKRLGSVSTTSPPRPAFIWGPALNWENTVSALRIYFMSR